MLKAVRVEPNLKIDEGPVDPDELQLMDECNMAWVRAWKEATACPDLMKVGATSHGRPRK